MIWKEGRCLHGYSALLFVECIGFEAIDSYCSQVVFREVFFVSGAQRKSQTAGPLGSNPRVAARRNEKCAIADFSLQSTAFFAVSVHRAACYWARSEQ